MKYGILPEITEKKIYFASIGDLVDYKYDLREAKIKISEFFKVYIEEYDTNNDIQNAIYKEMNKEYERIDHLLRLTELRIGNI